MDSVRAGPFGQLFRPDNFVFGEYELSRTSHKSLVFQFSIMGITNIRRSFN